MFKHILTIKILIFFSISSAFAISLKKEPLIINSKQLFSSKKNNFVEFVGNVNGKQGKNTIKSQRLIVYYQKSQSNNPEKDSSIDKIIAKENVKIFMDGKRGFGQYAEYKNSSKILTLKGKNSQFIDENQNTIKADTIIYNQKTGKVAVEGKTKQLEATIKMDN